MVYKNKIDFTKKKYYNKAVLLEQNLKLIMVYFKFFYVLPNWNKKTSDSYLLILNKFLNRKNNNK